MGNSLPVVLALSIVSLTDHLPKSIALSSGLGSRVGAESSSSPKSPKPDLWGVFAAAFLVSALLSAICSRMLRAGAFGDKGSSSGKGFVRFIGAFAGVVGRKACKLLCGRRVLALGVGLGDGRRRVLVDAPSREPGVTCIFTGVRGVVRDEDGGGMRDIGM
jgi:hypothetical protein